MNHLLNSFPFSDTECKGLRLACIHLKRSPCLSPESASIVLCAGIHFTCTVTVKAHLLKVAIEFLLITIDMLTKQARPQAPMLNVTKGRCKITRSGVE